MSSDLTVLLGDDEVGSLRRDRRGRVTFSYAATWRRAKGAYPVSVSMPLALETHPHKIVDAYLWGLLPDDEIILERWARRFQASARSAFALLAHVGEDCAGAIRFVRPERVRDLVQDAKSAIEWLDEAGVAERLRALRRDTSAWRQPTDTGQFSLAGAQPKTALYRDGKRWGVPSGRTPTTHILKPGSPDLDGHAENEHFCVSLARDLGLPTAATHVARFEDEVAIVVERYDRIRSRNGVVRVHQEDMCQALGVHPASKYESDGGPGPKAIAELLRDHSRAAEEDIATFVGALAFNWLVGGTDAHGKNYSILIGAEGRVRLAPLYDVASVLPYTSKQLPKVKLAMKIGGKYRLLEIGIHQWRKLATELALDPDRVEADVRQLVARAPDLAADLARRSRGAGLDHRVVMQLADAIAERARRCV